eukprot:2699171-Prymnesium_polylepis.1
MVRALTRWLQIAKGPAGSNPGARLFRRRAALQARSWELQRPHLKAGNFAVIVGGAVASSPFP